jgi:glutamate formiminotransferase
VLVSFPPPTKMLPFGGFPLREGAFLGSPIQVSPVRRLHAPTRGGFAACRALHRLSSRAILQTALAWSGHMVVSVWRLVNTFFGASLFCLCVVSCELVARSPLRSCIRVGAELHLFLKAYSMLLDCFRSEFR